MLGKIFSEEHRRKIGLIHKGKIESEETRKKKSISALHVFVTFMMLLFPSYVQSKNKVLLLFFLNLQF